MLGKFGTYRPIGPSYINYTSDSNSSSVYALIGDSNFPSYVWEIRARNPDSEDHTITVQVDSTAPAWDVIIPAGAGMGTVPAYDCLGFLRTYDGFDGIGLETGRYIELKMASLPPEGVTVTVWAFGGVFLQ